MTPERANDIERKVFDAHINAIKHDLGDGADIETAFEIGWDIGYMQRTLAYELEKETDIEGGKAENEDI